MIGASNGPPTVVVVGSLHMDLIASAERLPAAGESVHGDSFVMQPGGKAGNQAVAVARAGGRAVLLTRLGNDTFGHVLRDAASAEGVDMSHVATDPSEPTGVSTVFTVHGGDYASIIVPASATRLSAADLDHASEAFKEAGALILQLEIPVLTSALAAERARISGATVLLNAAPIPAGPASIPESLWAATDIIVANGIEAAALLERPLSHDPRHDALTLRERFGLEGAVITLGSAGVVASTATATVHVDAIPVKVIDTVGAGDAFLGSVATQIAQGVGLVESLPRAVAAGALAVTRSGAQAAIPTVAELDAFIAKVGLPEITGLSLSRKDH